VTTRSSVCGRHVQQHPRPADSSRSTGGGGRGCRAAASPRSWLPKPRLPAIPKTPPPPPPLPARYRPRSARRGADLHSGRAGGHARADGGISSNRSTPPGTLRPRSQLQAGERATTVSPISATIFSAMDLPTPAILCHLRGAPTRNVGPMPWLSPGAAFSYARSRIGIPAGDRQRSTPPPNPQKKDKKTPRTLRTRPQSLRRHLIGPAMMPLCRGRSRPGLLRALYSRSRQVPNRQSEGRVNWSAPVFPFFFE